MSVNCWNGFQRKPRLRLMRRLSLKVSCTKAPYKLRSRLFDHIQKLSLSFHDATAVGDSLYRVTSDTQCAQELFNSGLMPAITAAITLVSITWVMLSINWMVTLVALLIGIPLLLLIRRVDRPMTESSLRVHERESDVSTHVEETLT